MLKGIKLLLAVCIATTLAFAQQTPPAPSAAKANRALGEVTAIDGSNITIAADAGGSVTVTVDDKTSYLRVPPGETDLKKASQIKVSDIGVGDRVLARLRPAEGQANPNASTIIVMTKTDLAQRQTAERAAWRQKGIAGTVTAVDPATSQITVKVRTREGSKEMTVETADAKFRRYAPDSVRFSDAKPSTLADVKVGDQVRALGDKGADETHYKAQEVVSGTFKNIAGTVASIDPASGEIKITNLETKKPVMVKVNTDSTMRRLPPQMAFFIARMQNGGAAGGPGGAGNWSGRPGGPGGPPGGAPGGAPGAMQQRPSGASGPGGPGGGAGFNRGSGDLSQMIERMPPLQLSELKPGDALIIASTVGADPSKVTAITVLAGVEPILTSPSSTNQAVGGNWNFGNLDIVAAGP